MQHDPGTWGRSSADPNPPWPQDKEGNPEEACLLTALSDAGGMAELTATQLRSYGIPVLHRYPGDGAAGRVILGFSGYGVELYVPASRLEEARELLRPVEDLPEEDSEGPF